MSNVDRGPISGIPRTENPLCKHHIVPIQPIPINDKGMIASLGFNLEFGPVYVNGKCGNPKCSIVRVQDKRFTAYVDWGFIFPPL